MKLLSVFCERSELQASGNKCKNTSPSNPPTAKLNNTLSDFDSAAAFEKKKNENVYQSIADEMNRLSLDCSMVYTIDKPIKIIFVENQFQYLSIDCIDVTSAT